MSKKQKARTSTNHITAIIKLIYDYIQVLSLDVVIGSIVVSSLFANITNADINFNYYYFLGVSVWLVYTMDHLIDAYKIKGIAITFRHRFHQTYFKTLALIWSIIFTVSIITAYLYLPQQIILLGLYVVVIVSAHLILVVFLWTKISKIIQKEVSVGIGYTLGVLLLPYIYGTKLNAFFFFFSLELFMIVMLNIYLFSYYDKEKDKLQGQISIAKHVGNSGLLLLLNFVFIVTSLVMAIITLMFTKQLHYQLIFFCMLVALWLIFIYHSYFNKNDRYRILGDAIFLFPLILVAYEWL